MEKGNVFIRKAVREDAELVLDFIKGIARYEKMEDEVEATVEMIEEQLFDKRRAEVIFAMENDREVGFALFFHNFSTFVGRSGLYLEDLFVLPEYRGRGYGKALFLELVRIARERNCGRMEWVCLDWNKPSIDFYRSMGAVPLDEWTTYRLAGDALARLAE
ncbi:MAG: GNAT family N-acetyltransferase [Bacteroidaceae bacterium]|nr:GNAT family N-acetyltransferase [Bacteroidaceae bacterium]MBR5456980.1 GNAT family N-acetyltransferase [Bacteroidaceae bacterium]